MAEKYKWDIEQLQFCIRKLKRERQNLEDYRTQLRTFKSNVNEAWMSIAGTAYENNLDIDEDMLIQIINSLNDEIEKLEKVVSKCYTP
ncbi:MAG: hypothetical protein IJ167_05255, partial [Lachnospiraceae bacterium]|nr:hypothetical protein [Lachnospiraceae bacterium]